MTWTAKRFYGRADVAPNGDGFTVTLDGRPVRTPGGKLLAAPTAALAHAVATEWEAQTDQVRPSTMPLTCLAATALDRVAVARDAVVAELIGYGLSDLVCYRALGPGDLADRQDQCWQPLVDWIAATHGVTLSVTRGVMPVEQPAPAGNALGRAFSTFSDFELTAVAALVQGCGSAVIGLALAAGRVGVDDGFQAAELDASYQIEHWGADAEAEARRQQTVAELSGAKRFLDLVRSSAGGPGPPADRGSEELG